MFAASSILFVPGARPDRFAKAAAGGAGLVVIDLEDSVPADGKAEARENALAAVAAGEHPYAIRLNALTTAAGIADLDALVRAEVLPEFMLLTMVGSAEEPAIIAAVLGERCPGLVPTIETPRGLAAAPAIAAEAAVAAVMFGGADFSAELGVAIAWEPLLLARQQIVLAAAGARKPAIDVPYIHLDDDEGLAAECVRSRGLGFACKAAIHPRQVEAIETAFAPSEAEIAEAEEALAVFEEAGGKAIRHKGRMLEAPIVKQYRAVLARSKGTADA